jgi:hypothetical protein
MTNKHWSEMTNEELKGNFTVELTEAQKAVLQPKEKRETAPTKPPRPTSQHILKTNFVRFPMAWARQLVTIDAGKCTYQVALYLLHEVWRTKSNFVKVTNVGLKQWGVGRKGKQHALDQLRDQGLISVENRGRKSPVVKVKLAD